jgi:hypothetical protein
MRTPSARCTPNTVTTRTVVSWAPDAAGGRQATFSAWSAPIACSVQPSSGLDVAPHLREEQVTYLTVFFHGADPGLKLRDQVLWNGQTLTVTGVLNASGRGVTFKVLCELRQ